MPDARCWTLTTGEAGMTSQAIGLAEAVGLTFEHKTIGLRAPWRWLPGHLCPGVLHGLTPGSDPIEPPWPELLISCGRRSAAVSIAIRRLSGGRTLTVHIQDPQIPARYFDLVVPPRHDGLEGDNVIATRGALHRVTPEKLAEAAQAQSQRFAHLPRPLVAVLVGGSNRTCRLTPQVSTSIGKQLAALASNHGASIALTPSRRTGADNVEALREALQGVPHFIWDGQGENPYFALLGLADHIVVTGDSVSMLSEAASTGKPVFVADLEGYSKRLLVFHHELRREGVTRPFPGPLERWDYEPVNDTARVAECVRELLERRLGA
ncbi:MAG: mitochondrial fission ELM1 family protein [Thioalkalivibrio sp.]